MLPTGERVPEYGLLPPGKQEDNALWSFWLGNNAWAYHGLRAAADLLAWAGHPRGQSLLAEAEEYRRDILSSFGAARERSPLVVLADGEAVRHTPGAVGRSGRGKGWINEVLYGPIHLHTCGVVGAEDQLVTDALDDFEDNLAMSADWGLVVPPAPENWFSEGGRCCQHTLLHTFLCYLERDEIPAALRAFFNTLAAIFDADMAYVSEWSAYAGMRNGPPHKVTDESSILMWLRWMLVYEQGDALRLLPATPREWMREGRVVSIARAPTFHGPVSVRAVSQIESLGTIKVDVDLSGVDPGVRVVLRLRHPSASPIVSATVNGGAHAALGEEIDLSGFREKIEVVARYR
jgi:hypothetical protein